MEPNINKTAYNPELFQQTIYQNYDQQYSHNKVTTDNYIHPLVYHGVDVFS